MDRITTPFGFSSTADEVLHGVDLKGKHALITGGASGIGVDTAQALAKAGAAVTLAVRNIDAGKVVAQRMTHATGNQEVFVRPLDLADQQSIAAFLASWEGRLEEEKGTA
jgi:NAD(P)-dependent dehydrogenase (short-subunit alcohol dehydrogenase family)